MLPPVRGNAALRHIAVTEPDQVCQFGQPGFVSSVIVNLLLRGQLGNTDVVQAPEFRGTRAFGWLSSFTGPEQALGVVAGHGGAARTESGLLRRNGKELRHSS